jgi:hypothetical protein
MHINFKINRNEHYTNNWLYKFFNLFHKCVFKHNKILKYDIKFKNNCLYKPKNDDINKLFGFSLGFDHMNNSIRFGWRSNNKVIEIFAFYHINKQFKYRKICEVLTEKEYKYICSVYTYNEYYFYKLEVYDDEQNIGNYKSYKFKFDNKINFSYNLYPYFGGDLKCPNDMNIIFCKSN